MKTIIAALVLMTSTAFAQMSTLPVMPRLAHTLLSINQIDENIKSIELNSNGDVIVTPRITRNLVIFKLSPSNKADMLYHADYLNNVELSKTVYEVVCMAMPNPHTERTVSVFNKVTGQMRLVLSPSGCMYSIRVFPKDEYARELVQEVRSQLITLARQKLNK